MLSVPRLLRQFSKQEAQSFHNNASSSLDRETQLLQDAHKKGALPTKVRSFFPASVASARNNEHTVQPWRASMRCTVSRMRNRETFPRVERLILEISSFKGYGGYMGEGRREFGHTFRWERKG